jgi:hypothetical protein
MSGTNYNADTTISTDTIVESPAEIRLAVTLTIDETGTLTVRSLIVADTTSEIELYKP